MGNMTFGKIVFLLCPDRGTYEVPGNFFFLKRKSLIKRRENVTWGT